MSLSSSSTSSVSEPICKRSARVSNGSDIHQTPLATPRSATSPVVLLSQPATPPVVLPLQSAIPTNSGVVLLPSLVIMEAPVTSVVVALVRNATLPVISGVVAVVPNSLGIAASITIPAIQSYDRGTVVIKSLNRPSTQGEVAQVIANIRPVIHGYAAVEYIGPVFT